MQLPAANDNKPVDPAATIAALLRKRQEVSDEAFDSLLTELPRKKSRTYWSSVEAAQTAARLLREAGATQVLDAGSGVGKFCTIASLDSSHRVWGVERRGELVFESRRLAQLLGAEVVITEGTLDKVDASEFDGFYFFNPFGEYVAADEDRYDLSSPRSFDAYIRDARLVERWLRAAPVGTAMVTYNGLGGRIPLSWKVEKSRLVGGDYLRLWVKRTASEDTSDALIELNEHLVSARQLAGLIRGKDPRVRGNPLVARLVAGFS
jgi:predicted RNA methylase